MARSKNDVKRAGGAAKSKGKADAKRKGKKSLGVKPQRRPRA